MKLAIIGAGFAGLSTAYFLQEACDVTVFDAVGIGGGASSVCSGLLHPYPGFAARRSFKAEEALSVAKQLIRVAEAHTPRMVSSQNGIVRQAIDFDQKARLLDACQKWKDIEYLDEDRFLIHSGITVLSENYLEGLWNALEKRGVKLLIQKIEALSELEEFDQIVIAAGYGILSFPECANLNVKFLKGQAFRMSGVPPIERSFISKGYIAHMGRSDTFDLGSTYEREFQDDKPNPTLAKQLLAEKLALTDAEILTCKAGVRVCNRSHYLPIIEQVAENAHVFTGLGSRGLLYHGLFGRTLAQKLLSNS